MYEHPPQRADRTLAFERFTPEQRRDYLDGWSTARLKTAAPPEPQGYFSLGFWEAFKLAPNSTEPYPTPLL